MFPVFEPQIENGVGESTSGKSFKFDFSKGDFILKDGKLESAEGIEAIRVFIQKIIKTERDKFKIYDENYGVDLLDLINSGHPIYFIQSEIQREITEALLKNVDILDVYDFNFTRENRTLVVNFSVKTIYGVVSEEVSF